MKLLKMIRDALAFVFQKRSVIVMSQRGTHHMDLGARTQLIALLMVAIVFGWGSYSTGKYMAARTVMESQDETINAMANARVAKSFSFMPPSLSASGDADKQMQTNIAALSAMDQDKLIARIMQLEARENELISHNEKIMQTVRERAVKQIAGLEQVLRTTGLEPRALTRESTTRSDSAEGGPYEPALPGTDESVRMFDDELKASVDRLTQLGNVIRTLPLSVPVKNGSFESGFGSRTDPFSGRMAFHSGIDLAGPSGTQALATAAGKVSFAGYRGAYGNMVEVDHPNGISTRYAHLSRILVQEGQTVNKGDAVGIQGSTGRSTGAHVHYEVRYNDRPLNPTKFLAAGKLYVSQIQN